MERKYIRRMVLNGELPADSYLRDVPAVRCLGESGGLEFDRDVTFLVGENGTGKSTLLEAAAVAMGFNAEGGGRNFRFSTRDTHSPLVDYLTVVRQAYPKDGFFLRAESFYNASSYIEDVAANGLGGAAGAAEFLQKSYGGASPHAQSHGESFLALVQNRFSGNGLYFLDEPEAALSPMRQLVLLGEMRRLVEKRSQFLIATHSPILMAYPGARIYEITPEGVRAVAYRETEHYAVTKAFLDAPERMLRTLFGEEEKNGEI